MFVKMEMIGNFPWMKTKRYFSSLLLQLGENPVSLRLRQLKKFINNSKTKTLRSLAQVLIGTSLTVAKSGLKSFN